MKLTTSSKEEVKVSVNGKQLGVMKAGTPLELKDLEPGKLTLRFEGDDAFGVVEKEVELKKGQTLDLGEIKLPLAKVKTTFELDNRAALVTLVKEKDGKRSSSRLVFSRGKAVKTLDTSYTWKVTAKARGYEDLEQAISFGDSPTSTVKVELSKEEPVATSKPTPGPAPTTSPKPGPAPGPRPQPVAGGTGTLNANSIPPSRVIIDGRPRGSTPVTGVKVSAGSHTVIFRHKTMGTKSRTVTVAAGQTKTAVVRFKKK